MNTRSGSTFVSAADAGRLLRLPPTGRRNRRRTQPCDVILVTPPHACWPPWPQRPQQDCDAVNRAQAQAAGGRRLPAQAAGGQAAADQRFPAPVEAAR